MGRALSNYPRDSFYIADKFNVQANPDYEAQFSEQLNRLQTEYIDFYLLHGITDLTARDYEDAAASLFSRTEAHGENQIFRIFIPRHTKLPAGTAQT